jgi:hypothetical protein
MVRDLIAWIVPDSATTADILRQTVADLADPKNK